MGTEFTAGVYTNIQACVAQPLLLHEFLYYKHGEISRG